jgi:hypothetical protein
MHDNKQGGRKEGKYPAQLDIRNNKWLMLASIQQVYLEKKVFVQHFVDS